MVIFIRGGLEQVVWGTIHAFLSEEKGGVLEGCLPEVTSRTLAGALALAVPSKDELSDPLPDAHPHRSAHVATTSTTAAMRMAMVILNHVIQGEHVREGLWPRVTNSHHGIHANLVAREISQAAPPSKVKPSSPTVSQGIAQVCQRLVTRVKHWATTENVGRLTTFVVGICRMMVVVMIMVALLMVHPKAPVFIVVATIAVLNVKPTPRSQLFGV